MLTVTRREKVGWISDRDNGTYLYLIILRLLSDSSRHPGQGCGLNFKVVRASGGPSLPLTEQPIPLVPVETLVAS